MSGKNERAEQIVGKLLKEGLSGACECGDSGCPVHKGKSRCSAKATQTVFRIDMEDETGTDMCDDCANDAIDSGVFTYESEEEVP